MKRIFPICLLFVISLVSGCGKLPSGQERIIRFTVSDFTLSIPMYWTAQDDVAARLPGIMRCGRSVYEVLEQQGRSAGLSFAAISTILEQLVVQTNYVPLQCDIVNINPSANNADLSVMMGKTESCYIQGTTVIRLCRAPIAPQSMCMFMGAFTHIIPVPSKHLMLSGNLTVSNVVMAGWTTQMWQSVFNRVLRSLQTGRLRSNFATATVTLT